ncbi:unnamed protein product [Diatraea saccharalis]|uniref:MICOS complex subunit n=1 Tax=Diatraea saccharalis TaxID=40085 RepID=A0A9N9RD31_9NEOP|nr:unnamed protein product [Diatraea saccharalis]
MQPIKDSEEIEECENDEIFKSEDDMKKSLSRLCYGDLFVIGRIWIEALQAVLVGAKFRLIPVVEAAAKNEPPKKPPPMKYKDLPIYENPHYEYKDYIADKQKCPGYKDKIIHNALLPHVTKSRKKALECYGNLCCTLKSNCNVLCSTVRENKKNFKDYMRHPDNLALRQGVLATGTLTGFLLGGGGGVPRRFFFTSLGALAAGALCFPKETDEYFREACYHSAKAVLAVYNTTCGKNFALRERIPCKDDLPKEPKPRKPLCPQKK